MKALLVFVFLFIFINFDAQTFNPAEWDKANKFENKITAIEYVFVAGAFCGLFMHSNGIIWTSIGSIGTIEAIKMRSQKINKHIYFRPLEVGLQFPFKQRKKR